MSHGSLVDHFTGTEIGQHPQLLVAIQGHMKMTEVSTSF